MKILFISREYPPETGGGGIGSYVASITPALVARGHEVHVLSCVTGQDERDYVDAGVYIHRRGQARIPGLSGVSRILRLSNTMWRLHNGLSVFMEYRRLGINFDLIEHPDWGAEGWMLALFHTKPLVAHLHTPFLLIRQYNGQPLNRDVSFASCLERFAVSRSDLITSPSNLLVKTLKKDGWLGKLDVEILPYALDWHRWHETNPVENTGPTVLFLGRLERRKGPELLVQAISILRKDLPNIKVLFVGRSGGQRDGLPYKEWIKRLTDNCDEYKFTGQIPRFKLKEFLSAARVVVMPSWFESFGLVAAEAMAAGRPVVVTSTSGVAELIEPSKSGVIVPPGDPKALAEALRNLLKYPKYASEIGNRAKSHIRAIVDPDKIAAKRETLYLKAIDSFIKHLGSKANGFPHAMHNEIGNFQIPAVWRNWAADEAVIKPWKHFYLQTARQLLELLTREPYFAKLTTLRGIRVLDVGCTPAVSILLACLGAKVILLDNSTEELNKGVNYARRLGVQDRVSCVKADAFELPFKAESFNIAWNSGFIEHFDNPQEILQKMGGVVRPGMALVVLVPNGRTPHSLWIRERLRRRPEGYYWDFMGRERSYNKDQLVTLVRNAGFSVKASSSGDLRRSLLDDILVLPHLERMIMRGFLFRLMNSVDWIENHIILLKRFGFMVGVLAQVPKQTNHT